MKNVLVLQNFKAGRKQAIKYKKQVLKFLLKKNVSYKFCSIEELDNLNMNYFDTILVMGGDGTINKVLPYLKDSEKVLGIIPCGTANLLAYSLGINNIPKALKVIENQGVSKLDLIDINGNLSILRLGIGYDADIICKTPQSVKNKFGYFSYFVAGILFALRLKLKEYKLKISDEEKIFKTSCIIIANASNMYRNLVTIGKNSTLEDGLFDIFILKTQNPIIYFIEFLKIILNIKQSNRFVEYLKSDLLKIENNYCIAHIDGEKIKFNKDILVKILSNKIKIFS